MKKVIVVLIALLLSFYGDSQSDNFYEVILNDIFSNVKANSMFFNREDNQYVILTNKKIDVPDKLINKMEYKLEFIDQIIFSSYKRNKKKMNVISITPFDVDGEKVSFIVAYYSHGKNKKWASHGGIYDFLYNCKSGFWEYCSSEYR